MRNGGVARLATADGQAFDLNIENVLEHWPVSYAVREFIANALDEQILSGTDEPAISKTEDGVWHIRDYGRGVRYEHLTQKENQEKLRHPQVIGQFGIGLKDALAVCDRRDVNVRLRSRHGDITTATLPKAGFPDVITLHGLIAAPSEPTMAGTDVELTGVADEHMAAAKGFFLRFSDTVKLEEHATAMFWLAPPLSPDVSTSGGCGSPRSRTSFSRTTSPTSAPHSGGP